MESAQKKTCSLTEYWPDFAPVIRECGIEWIEMKLHSDKKGLMNEMNMPKFLTTATKESIIIGKRVDAKDKEDNGPYMILRYIDAENNKEQGLPENATSFLVLQYCYVHHVGIEMMMCTCKWTKNAESVHGFSLNSDCQMNLDGSRYIINFVSKMIRGELENKKLRFV